MEALPAPLGEGQRALNRHPVALDPLAKAGVVLARQMLGVDLGDGGHAQDVARRTAVAGIAGDIHDGEPGGMRQPRHRRIAPVGQVLVADAVPDAVHHQAAPVGHLADPEPARRQVLADGAGGLQRIGQVVEHGDREDQVEGLPLRPHLGEEARQHVHGRPRGLPPRAGINPRPVPGLGEQAEERAVVAPDVEHAAHLAMRPVEVGPEANGVRGQIVQVPHHRGIEPRAVAVGPTELLRGRHGLRQLREPTRRAGQHAERDGPARGIARAREVPRRALAAQVHGRAEAARATEATHGRAHAGSSARGSAAQRSH
jgi:hypothetical protein